MILKFGSSGSRFMKYHRKECGASIRPRVRPRPAGRLLIRNGCRPRPGMRNTNYTAVRLFPYHGVYILLLLLVVRAGPRSEERGKHIIGDERISAGAHTIVVSLHGQHARRELELLARRQR